MPDRASAVTTILFTDLVGSTELLSRVGDEEAQRVFRAHHDLLAEAAAAHGGEEVKWLGDGLMVAFASAADAVRCAVAMQQASRRLVQGERLTIRVGLNAGETLRDAADYFGTPVVVARRLCDRADAGQILCTELVAGLLGGRTGISFSALGRLELKGVPEPVATCEVRYEVTTTGLPSGPGLGPRLHPHGLPRRRRPVAPGEREARRPRRAQPAGEGAGARLPLRRRRRAPGPGPAARPPGPS
ncbi:MAG: adenylate/guanylate cyclase domain-containing protein [Acidimicrobiia bacterium]